MPEAEKRPVKISREELESLVLKSRPRPWLPAAVPLLLVATLIAIFLLMLTILPQATVDRWVARLQSARMAVSQSPLVNTEKLDLLRMEDDWVSPVLSVAGIIRNRTTTRMAGIEAVIKLHDRERLITTLIVDLDTAELAPNQRGGFRATYRLSPDMAPPATYDLSFKLKDGTAVLHQDLRGSILN